MPSLGNLGLWGIDELITYHYLEAELFRSCDLRGGRYWAMSKRQRADLFIAGTAYLFALGAVQLLVPRIEQVE